VHERERRPTAAPAPQPPQADRRHRYEPALVMAAKRGGAREREELVDAFLPLVGTVARVYRRSSRIERDELMQEGVVGLLRALERYDPERGVPFWGYAAWWVRQAMQQVVSELSGPVVLSDRALRQLARIKSAQRRFEQTCRRDAATTELSAIVGLPQSQVESLLRTDRAARGLDEPTSADAGDGATVGELVVDPPAQEAYDRTCERVMAAELPRLLSHLTARERNVICCRYGLGEPEQTLREIAPTLGVSAERVRQIEQEALAKLHAVEAQART
jgi:RNA polymerase primary sigma factor